MRGSRTILALCLGGVLAVTAAAPQPAAARSQGGLRVADPVLVRDGDRWLSLASSESLADPQATPCDPADSVWDKGFAHLPYRAGPSPEQLDGCWAGDALPGGPGGWADAASGSVTAPAVARVGEVWWLAYTARVRDSDQRCIGLGASTRPLVCQADGRDATDPELFYDLRTAAWYLLWVQEADGTCTSRVLVQRLDMSTGTLTGTARQLLAACAVESPAMVRADSGELWLFTTVEGRTGWASCGAGSPTQGAGCSPVSRLAFPAGLPGFGGLSLTAGESAVGVQPVYATGELRWGGSSDLRTQLVFRLDTTGALPALYEPGTVTLHGRAGSFGNELLGPVTPSGQLLATRAVPEWGWPAGHQGIFNTATQDGTLVVQGWSTDVADGFMAAGVYDPKANEWTTVRAKTSNGFDTVSPFTEGDQVLHGGASAWDVQALDDGSVAFTNLFGVAEPFVRRGRVPAEGVWPSFGVLAKTGGRWQVAAQWTAAELARSNPDSDVDERACSPYDGMPDSTSLCGGPNELATLPRSRDLIVALYAGDGYRTSSGLMAVRVEKADGRYDARIVGYYAYPEVNDFEPIDPTRPRKLLIAVKTVETDPSSQLGDERFSVVADLFHADPDDQHEPAEPLALVDPSVTQEFSYDARTGEIKPVSAPFFAGVEADGSTVAFRGVHGGVYDHQGNLWTQAGGLVVYAKSAGSRKLGGAACPFDRARFEARPESYSTTAGGRTVWGQVCAPDYEIPQGKDVGGRGQFLQLAEDPVTRAIVGIDTWGTGNVIAVRHSGAGLDKTFEIGNLVDTGRDLLPRPSRLEQRPAAFDRTGRMWVAFHQWPPGPGYTDPLDSWMVSVDVARLFEAPAVPVGSSGVVQAEQTATTGTRRSPLPGGAVRVDALAHVVPLPGDGFSLGGAGGADYRVYAPAAGTYRIGYQVRGCGSDAVVELRVGDATYRTAAATACSWRLVNGPEIQLAAGVHTLRLSAPAGAWSLDWFRLYRLL